MRRKQADSYGFTAEDARCILEGRRAELTPREIDKLITAAIEKALERRTSEQAHLSKHDLVQDVCIATVIHGIDPETIRARVERTLGEGNFISLGRHREHKRYATTQMYRAVEAKALEVAERLGGRYGHVVSEPRVEKAIAKEPRLNDGQKDAVRTVCLGPDITYLTGPPGAGKTTLLAVVRKAIEQEGGNVIGLAPSNRAARELERGSGIASFTVHRFLYDRERTVLETAKHHAAMVVRTAFGLPTWKPPALDVNRRTTIVIDEAVMVDNDRLSRALVHAEKAGCRVVLLGDPAQLPAIGPGGLVRQLMEQLRPDQKFTLTENVRQREAWAREAIQRVGQGDLATIRSFEAHGRLHVAPTRDDAECRLVERWKDEAVRDPQDSFILASTNEQVDRLNAGAQRARHEAGCLGVSSLQVRGERIHVGDRILFTDTNRRLGLIKSEFATVTHLDLLTRRLTVRIDGQEKPVTFSLRQFDALRLGYAATTHRAQGMTLDQNAYVLFGGSMQSRELTYVQISRARGETHLFTDERSHGALELLMRSQEKLSAHQIQREAGRRREHYRQQELRLQPEIELSL